MRLSGSSPRRICVEANIVPIVLAMGLFRAACRSNYSIENALREKKRAGRWPPILEFGRQGDCNFGIGACKICFIRRKTSAKLAAPEKDSSGRMLDARPSLGTDALCRALPHSAD